LFQCQAQSASPLPLRGSAAEFGSKASRDESPLTTRSWGWSLLRAVLFAVG
jgi:hypothetical protein